MNIGYTAPTNAKYERPVVLTKGRERGEAMETQKRGMAPRSAVHNVELAQIGTEVRLQ